MFTSRKYSKFVSGSVLFLVMMAAITISTQAATFTVMLALQWGIQTGQTRPGGL